MKPRILTGLRLLCLVLALALVALPGTAEEPSEEATSRLDRLETSVKALREEVAALRFALDKLSGSEATAHQVEAPALENIDQRLSQRLDERLEAIEQTTQQVSQEQANLAASLSNTEAALGDLEANQLRRPQLTVYGTFTAYDWEKEDSVFDGESFELVTSGRPHERLSYFAEIEFERAAEVGADRGGEVLIEQAWAGYSISPSLDIRAGIVLVPFGNFNVDHYAPVRDTISRPLVSQVVAPADWTDNGVGIYGSRVVGETWALNYEAYLIAGLDSNITAFGTRAARQSFGVDNNDNKALVGRLGLQKAGDLELGASLYSGAYDDAGNDRLEGWALDAQWRRRHLSLIAEWNHFSAERSAGPSSTLEGGYVRLVYDLVPAFLRLGWHGQSFPSARLSLVGQYDQARLEGPLPDAAPNSGLTTLEEERFTFGLNYRPSYQWVLKLDWERNRASDLALFRGDREGFLLAVGFQF